jgi:anthranilate synthase component 1
MTQVCLSRLTGCPDLLDLHALEPARYPILLESTGGVAALARHDILFAFPGRSIQLDSSWQLAGCASNSGPGDFLRAFDAAWREEGGLTPGVQGLPFHGGWFVFLGYELAQQIDGHPRPGRRHS